MTTNVNQLPFNNKCPPEVLDKAKEWLVTNRPSFSRVTNFAIFRDDGMVSAFPAQVCHAKMGSVRSWDGKRACVATEIGITRTVGEGNATADIYLPFLDFLLGRSHYSRFILNRDDFAFCRDYGIVISSDIPSPLFQNILITSRYFYEHDPEAFIYYNELVADGIPEAVAMSFAFSSNLSYWSRVDEEKRLPKNRSDIVTCWSGHRAQRMWRSVKELQNFLSGEYKTVWIENYRDVATTMGGMAYCCEYGADYQTIFEELFRDEEYRKELKLFRNGGEGHESVIRNPFAPGAAKLNSYDVTYTELKDFVLPYMQMKGMFNVDANLDRVTEERPVAVAT